MVSSKFLLSLACLSTAFLNASASEVRYKVTTPFAELNTPQTIVTGLNSSGNIAGYVYQNDGTRRAFSYVNGQLSLLPTFGGVNSVANGINELNQIVGWSGTLDPSVSHAFIYSGGNDLTEIGSLGGRNSVGYGINNLGQIAGYTNTTLPFDNDYGALIASKDAGPSLVNLQQHSGRASFAYGINDSGSVVGTILTANGSSQVFIANGNDVKIIPDGQGINTIGIDINSPGQIVGSALQSDGVYHGFFYNGTDTIDLGTLSNEKNVGYGLGTPAYSGADALNDSGVIIGTYGYAGYGGFGFVYSDGQMSDLTSLVDTSGQDKWQFTPRAINNEGQIVAYGYRTNDYYQSYVLLTPYSVPEPGSLSLFSLAFLLAGKQRTKARRKPA